MITGHHEGHRYLVSVTGERADWVLNARAVDGRAVLRHGKRRKVSLVEVPAEDRAPILKAYLKWSLGARAIIEVSHNAPVGDFEAVAAKYPVFRITPRDS